MSTHQYLRTYAILSVWLSPIAVEAATISIDTTISLRSTTGYHQVTDTPFNAALGTLTSETYSFSGQVHDTINVFVPGQPTPGTYTTANIIQLPNSSTLVTLPSTTLVVTAQGGLTTSTYAPVTFTFSGGPYGVLNFDLPMHLMNSQGSFVAFDEGIEYLEGVLTETFTYTPAIVATVAEPASATIVLAGLTAVGLCTVSGKRRRRR